MIGVSSPFETNLFICLNGSPNALYFSNNIFVVLIIFAPLTVIIGKLLEQNNQIIDKTFVFK